MISRLYQKPQRCWKTTATEETVLILINQLYSIKQLSYSYENPNRIKAICHGNLYLHSVSYKSQCYPCNIYFKSPQGTDPSRLVTVHVSSHRCLPSLKQKLFWYMTIVLCYQFYDWLLQILYLVHFLIPSFL